MHTLSDAPGATRGKWTLVSIERTGQYTFWTAHCECGFVRRALKQNLNPRGCRACLVSGTSRERKPHVGERFDRLLVLEDLPGYPRLCRVRCDCGAERVVLYGNMQQGLTRSCGCLLDEARKRTKYGTKIADLSEHSIWVNMLVRCSDPNVKAYKYYGARGIFVCEGWRDFANFLADMGPRPTAGHSIDRRDNDGGYWCGHCAQCVAFKLPANCRWATTVEQARNRRNNVWLTHDGKTLLATDWAVECGVSRQRIEQRIKKYGPTDWRVFTKKGAPVHWTKVYTVGDVTLDLAGWSKRLRVSYATLHQRIARGVPLEAALVPIAKRKRSIPKTPKSRPYHFGPYRCRLCHQLGHNRRTCASQIREAA